ncbi:hypothetical protein [Kordia jejudonensis]|uniref:hypothetical protein n=1 Tax=Kordia jejudonensis TaxID=1348245 RepID=UPI0012E0B9DE|nr:hypothetical protein [Kordia jejudonensis]
MSTKNDYGMVRFKQSRFSIKPNNNQNYIQHIDTTVFYMAVHSKEFIKEYKLENFKNGIKFYGNGKVGHFKGIDFNNAASFNPKKATMGYYNYDGENFYVEYIYEIPGGTHKLAKSEIILRKSSTDTLIVKSFKSATSAEKITKYARMKIPVEALNYKVDW